MSIYINKNKKLAELRYSLIFQQKKTLSSPPVSTEAAAYLHSDSWFYH